jgi:hypothetical protein
MSRANRERRRAKQRNLEQVRESPGGFPLPPNAKIIHSPPGLAKMSEVFEDFMAPEIQNAEDEGQLRRVLTLGMIAWNASLLSPVEREELLEKTEQTLPADVRPELRPLVEPLIRRKEEHFAEHRRLILKYILNYAAERPQLQVLSTMPEE